MAKFNLNIMGKSQTVEIDPSTPLLWVKTPWNKSIEIKKQVYTFRSHGLICHF